MPERTHTANEHRAETRRGYSAFQRTPGYGEYLEFSSPLEYRKFRLMPPVSRREINRTDVDGLILAVMETA